jgi:acetyl esterase/lipase
MLILFQMKFKVLFLLAVSFISVNLAAFSQATVIPLWSGKIPGARSDPAYKAETVFVDGSPRVSRVTDPTLDFYPAPKETANGTAVIICPGGGYGRLAVDHEGSQVAVWFNKMGVTAFVLKYRLPSDVIMKDKSIGPLQDVQQAIRLVRSRSREFNTDPNKIGIMGFSAGGHLASTASTHFNEKVYETNDTTSARPDFSLLIYPVISMDTTITHRGSRNALIGLKPTPELEKRFSNELMVTDKTPPAFLVHATDDGTVPVENSIRYLLALRAHHIPAELHIYQKGGHGFGLGKSNGTESTWPEACKKWLESRGFLK